MCRGKACPGGGGGAGVEVGEGLKAASARDGAAHSVPGGPHHAETVGGRAGCGGQACRGGSARAAGQHTRRAPLLGTTDSGVQHRRAHSARLPDAYCLDAICDGLSGSVASTLGCCEQAGVDPLLSGVAAAAIVAMVLEDWSMQSAHARRGEGAGRGRAGGPGGVGGGALRGQRAAQGAERLRQVLQGVAAVPGLRVLRRPAARLQAGALPAPPPPPTAALSSRCTACILRAGTLLPGCMVRT